MPKISRLFFLITILIAISQLSVITDVAAETKADEHLDFFISPDLEGRGLGTDGNELTTDYVKDFFQKHDLKSPDELGYPDFEGYRFDFETPAVKWEGEPNLTLHSDENGEREFEYRQDFSVRKDDYSAGGDLKTEIKVLNDFEDMQELDGKIENKAVLVDYSEPTLKDRGYDEYELDQWLVHQDAGAVIYPESQEGIKQRDIEIGAKQTFIHSRGIIKLGVTEELFSELTEKPSNDCSLKISIPLNIVESQEAENVTGIIPGNSDLMDGYVLVAASLDGQGIDGSQELDPSLEDSAVPLTLLLEIINELQESDFSPDKTVIFTAFNASQQGDIGAQEFAEERPFPTDNKKVIYLDNFAGNNEKLELATYEPEVNDRERSAQLVRDLKYDLLDSHETLKFTKDFANAERAHIPFREQGIISVSLSQSQNKLSDFDESFDSGWLENKRNTGVSAIKNMAAIEPLRELKPSLWIGAVPLLGFAMGLYFPGKMDLKWPIGTTLTVFAVLVFITSLHTVHFQLEESTKILSEVSIAPTQLLNGFALAVPPVIMMFLWTWSYYIPAVIVTALSVWFLPKYRVIITLLITYACGVFYLVNTYEDFYQALFPKFLQIEFVQYILPLIVLAISFIIYIIVKGEHSNLGSVQIMLIFVLLNYLLLLYLTGPHLMSQEVLELRYQGDRIMY